MCGYKSSSYTTFPQRFLGSSKPGFFLHQDVEDFKSGMNLNYLGTLHAIKVKKIKKIVIRTFVGCNRIHGQK